MNSKSLDNCNMSNIKKRSLLLNDMTSDSSTPNKKRALDNEDLNSSTLPNLSQTNKSTSRDDENILSSFEFQKNNRYSEDSMGPFIVYLFDSRPDFNLGNIHITSVGLKLFKSGIIVSHLARAGTKKFSLTFENFETANAFVESGVSQADPFWKAFIPNTGLYITGIIFGVGSEATAEDILAGLDSVSKEFIDRVERVYTITRPKEGQPIITPSEKIKIYSKDKLPKYVSMFGIFHKVYYHIPAVLRCYSCQRFGHGANFCRNDSRCLNCGETDHPIDLGPCPNDPKCANCHGPHKASDKSCPWFEFHKEINSLTSIQKISKQKASFLVQQRFAEKIKSSIENNHVRILLDENSPFLNKRDLFEMQYSEDSHLQNIDFLNSTELEINNNAEEGILLNRFPQDPSMNDSQLLENYSHLPSLPTEKDSRREREDANLEEQGTLEEAGNSLQLSNGTIKKKFSNKDSSSFSSKVKTKKENNCQNTLNSKSILKNVANKETPNSNTNKLSVSFKTNKQYNCTFEPLFSQHKSNKSKKSPVESNNNHLHSEQKREIFKALENVGSEVTVSDLSVDEQALLNINGEY